MHIAPDTHDRHETVTTVGQIFGAHFATHALVTYNACRYDTYDRHETEKRVDHILKDLQDGPRALQDALEEGQKRLKP